MHLLLGCTQGMTNFYFYRWEVATKFDHHLSHLGRIKKRLMYNYMSVGVDAQVTLDFHRTRESAFYIISSRIFNKVLNCSILPVCLNTK